MRCDLSGLRNIPTGAEIHSETWKRMEIIRKAVLELNFFEVGFGFVEWLHHLFQIFRPGLGVEPFFVVFLSDHHRLPLFAIVNFFEYFIWRSGDYRRAPGRFALYLAFAGDTGECKNLIVKPYLELFLGFIGPILPFIQARRRDEDTVLLEGLPEHR